MVDRLRLSSPWNSDLVASKLVGSECQAECECVSRRHPAICLETLGEALPHGLVAEVLSLDTPLVVALWQPNSIWLVNLSRLRESRGILDALGVRRVAEEASVSLFARASNHASLQRPVRPHFVDVYEYPDQQARIDLVPVLTLPLGTRLPEATMFGQDPVHRVLVEFTEVPADPSLHDVPLDTSINRLDAVINPIYFDV